MTLDNLKELLNSRILSNHSDPEIDIQYAYASDLMSDILVLPYPGALLLTGLANTQAIRTSKIARVSVIVFVRDKKPDTDTIKLAKEYEIPILSTKLSMFEACGILFSNGIKGVPNKK